MPIIIFLIILAALILIHEFGHFILAKRAGIRVDEFGIGFPPRLFGIRKGETTYSVNLIPFGGFVKIFGEDPDAEALNGPDSPRSFINKPKSTQAAVIAAGIAFNVFFAWFLFSAAFAAGVPAPVDGEFSGSVENPRVIITSVLDDAPAQEAGLKTGDRINRISTAAESVEAAMVEEVQAFIVRHPGEELTVFYERGGEEANVTVVPAEGIIEGKPAIGIGMDAIGTLRLPLPSAVVEGAKLTFDSAGLIAVGFVTLIADLFRGGADLSGITGPVGIVGLVGDAAAIGFVNLITFTAFISVNLAVINLIPFPALDGGRLFFILIETIKRSPLNPSFARRANAVGFVLLILLMLIVTYHDIVKLL